MLFNPDVAEIALTRCAYLEDNVHYDYDFIDDYCDDNMSTPPPSVGIPLAQQGPNTSNDPDPNTSNDFAWLVDQHDEKSIGSEQKDNATITWNPKTHPLTLMVSLFFELLYMSVGALLLCTCIYHTSFINIAMETSMHGVI